MNSGATWTIADGGGSGKLWAGLHHDRKSARPHHSIGRARYCRRGGRVTACQMSHMGQKRRFDPLPATSGLARSTDINRPAQLVRSVPTPEVVTRLPRQTRVPLADIQKKFFGTIRGPARHLRRRVPRRLILTSARCRKPSASIPSANDCEAFSILRDCHSINIAIYPADRYCRSGARPLS
jgi:hypothetical protein